MGLNILKFNSMITPKLGETVSQIKRGEKNIKRG